MHDLPRPPRTPREPVSGSAAERAYQLTSELEGISYLKIVPNNDGNVSLHLIS